ncbi:deoxyguanosinetriphosphate triphosphohydrolase [Sedimentibacter sp. zth1]|uniref:deoxyguanosinetriphosphate triphosphohydrolase n=1 Tax=Sedimentibacter sp. zth1 TaxID=2816908 RepID=UPI001A936123|nr:deoxyguanosinetriphosphate triphosphohydrolase [Sedimentibacter sp. zth1]QSX06831.1 deoxyguanosinetriphosphate triphosphohydrolase [Sedimentibacter sp. zth1]
MNVRETYEELEEKFLSSYAVKSKDSLGRDYIEDKCEIRTDFQRDRDRIIHCKAFRRLIHKTQVFLSPEGDHYRTRLTHTLEVSQISRTIARALKLNEDLTEAIALGHDLGHTPFGHSGESMLNKLVSTGFSHNVQSLRVVNILETKSNVYRGLNLTKEVRDGIVNHTGSNEPMTLEGKIVRFSDRIAYINHDIDDAVRANIITIDQIPNEYKRNLGYSHSERINTMINDIIKNSENLNEIKMSDKTLEATLKLRQFLFENIYYNKTAKSEEHKSDFVISNLFDFYMNNMNKMPKFYLDLYDKMNFNKEEIVKDYISGMTDRYALKLFRELFVPNPWDK